MPGPTGRPDRPSVAARLFDLCPFGIAMLDHDGRYTYINPVLAAINGRPVADHLGADPLELFGPMVQPWVDEVRRVAETGEPVPPYRFVGDEQAGYAYSVAYYPADPQVTPDGGPGVVAVVNDVSAEYVNEQRLTVLAEAGQRLGSAASAQEVADAVAAAGVRLSGGAATYAVVEPDGCRFVALGGYPDALVEHYQGALIPLDLSTLTTDAARTGEVQRADDLDELLRRSPGFEDAVRSSGATAVLTVPITSFDAVVGVLDVVRVDGRAFTVGIEQAVYALGAMSAAALARVESVEQQSEQRLRRAFDAMLEDITICSAVRDGDGRIVDFVLTFANEASKDGAGRLLTEHVGESISDLYPRLHELGLFEAFVEVVETGRPFVDEERRYDDEVAGAAVHGYWTLRVTKLGDGYLAATRDVTDAVEARRTAQQALAAREREREAVHLLQQFALPIRLPTVPGVRLAAEYVPAEDDFALGGDWYDAYVLPDQRVALLMGDVAGHGREAAQAMIDTRRFLASIRAEVSTPGEALDRASAHLRALTADAFVTCCYAVVDPNRRTMSVASAGHPPPVLVGEAGSTVLSDVVGDPPLGVQHNRRYRTLQVALGQSAAALVLYTDGVVEHRGEDLWASFDRLAAVVGAVEPEADTICGAVVAGLHDRHDDCSVLVAALAAP